MFLFSKLNVSEENREEKTSSPKVKSREGVELIIVDESSMVSKDMLDNFLTISKKTHVLFVCDEAQIPPIGEVISPIFTTKHTSFTLTKNMRSEKSADAYQVDNFRHNVFETEIGKKIRDPFRSLFITKCKSETVPGESDMLELFDEPNKPGSSVVLTFTNRKKDKWNEYIRTFLFQEFGSTEPLKKIYAGEILIFSGYRKIDDFLTTKVYYSSDEIVLQKVTNSKKWLSYEPSCCNCENKNKNKKYKIQSCVNCNIQGHVEDGFFVNFFEFHDEYDTVWRLPENKEDQDKVKKLLNHQKKFITGMPAKKRKEWWSNYYKFKDDYAPELSYGYSMTTHKAQGSQWENVFLDYEDLCLVDPEVRDRMLYTAASRMRNTLHIVKYKE